MTKNASILIVEDDVGAQRVATTILTSAGYVVSIANNGVEALEVLEEQTFDVIILDLMMPKMSGYDLMTRLKQQPETQNIPVIMFTVKGESRDIIKGYRDYGCDYYISKPFTSAQLLQGVSLVLSSDEKKVWTIDDPDASPDDSRG